MINDFNEQQAKEELEKGYEPAKKLLDDPDAIERFLWRLEKKLRVIPHAGDTLASIPVLASLLRSFAKKEYTDIPIGSIIAITSALIYVVSLFDIIPDAIPGIGLLDDALVIAACLKLVESDVEEYVLWRKNNSTVLDI